MAAYDALVIGGGHNGLVAAAYLARSGARTLVLEARDRIGGAATTEAPWPDAPRLPGHPAVLRDEPDAADDRQGPATRTGTATRSSRWARTTRRSPRAARSRSTTTIAARNYDEIAKWSKKDADAWPKWNAWLEGLADVLGPLLLTVPPKLGSRKPARPGRDAAGWPGGSAAWTCARSPTSPG